MSTDLVTHVIIDNMALLIILNWKKNTKLKKKRGDDLNPQPQNPTATICLLQCWSWLPPLFFGIIVANNCTLISPSTQQIFSSACPLQLACWCSFIPLVLMSMSCFSLTQVTTFRYSRNIWDSRTSDYTHHFIYYLSFGPCCWKDGWLSWWNKSYYFEKHGSSSTEIAVLKILLCIYVISSMFNTWGLFSFDITSGLFASLSSRGTLNSNEGNILSLQNASLIIALYQSEWSHNFFFCCIRLSQWLNLEYSCENFGNYERLCSYVVD